MRAAFIVHGSQNIGMGHVMRTLSLALELRERNFQVFYFSKYSLGIEAVERQGFQTIKMPAREIKVTGFNYGEADELQEDLSFIETSLGIERMDVIVVDSYNISVDFFIRLSQRTKCLVYIDDLNLFPYPVDILVNGTVLADCMDYIPEHLDEKLLLGIKYNLVRKEFFRKPKPDIKRTVEDILITTGSADPYDMTGRFLDFFESFFAEMRYDKYIHFHIVVGGGFSKADQKRWNRKGVLDILLYENLEDISFIMDKCDLAISSGGSTLYELAARGVPSAAFSYADNQVMQVEILEKYGIVKNIGGYENIEKTGFHESIKMLINNYSFRRKMAGKARKLVDGEGCGRIVDEILESNLCKRYS